MNVNPLATEDWKRVLALLPSGWRQSAANHGLCLSRISADGEERSKLSDPELLLRLVLHHVATETPLVQTTAQAHAADLVSVSPVALHKRMRTVAPWLAEMTAQLIESTTVFAAERWAGFRVFATDATTGTRPGAMGTTLRVHYRLELATLTPQQLEMTDVHGGEMLRRFELSEGDLDLLDRAYCNPADIAHARAAHSDVIVRFNRGSLPLFDSRDRPINIVPRVLRMKRPGRVRSWSAWIHTGSGPMRVRVCAVRLSAEAAQRAQQWLRREHGSAVKAGDLEWAKYIVVVTTVPAERLSSEDVLDLFRLRWQAELQIKRDKSIGGLDQLPNFRDDTIASWINGKLLAQALARRLFTLAPFSPCAAGDEDVRSRAA
jgi:hypothetical protein